MNPKDVIDLLSDMSANAKFSDRVRFNWGFWDASHDVRHKNGSHRKLVYDEPRNPSTCSYLADKAYFHGYRYGIRWFKLGIRTHSSEPAWMSFLTTPQARSVDTKRDSEPSGQFSTVTLSVPSVVADKLKTDPRFLAWLNDNGFECHGISVRVAKPSGNSPLVTEKAGEIPSEHRDSQGCSAGKATAGH